MILFCRSLVLFCALTLAFPAIAFHGYSFELNGGERSISIYFKPDGGTAADWQYIAEPSGLMTRLVTLAESNRNAIAKLPNDYQVFLSFSGGSWTYIVEAIVGDSSTAVQEISDAGTPRSTLLNDVLCAKPIGLDCAIQVTTLNIVVYDGSESGEAMKLLPQNSLSSALVAFRPMGASPENSIMVFPISDLSGIPTATVPKGIQVGPAQNALEGEPLLFENTDIDGDLDGVGEPVERLDQRGDFKRIERSGYPRSSELDPKLQFIVLHCTAANMSRQTVHNIRKNRKRGVGHAYIMPDGEVIEIWKPTTRPNTILATKTELRKCRDTRPRALRSMYHIELNYKCNWRPNQSPDPTPEQINAAAKHIAEMFNTFGPFHLLTHTYVDMGINSRYAHTDPPGREGFNYNDFYTKIAEAGGDFSEVMKVEQWFANKYPFSLREVRHTFPPRLNQTLPMSGSDACDWPGR